MAENETIDLSKDPKVYEVGYLLLPGIADEKLPEEVGKIVAIIESNGGSIITSENPNRRTLAYSIVKHLAGKNTPFDTAYFGWVKFDVMPEGALRIKEALDKFENMLRFLMVLTVKFVAPLKRRTFKPHSAKVEGVPIPALSEAAIDQEVEQLIAATE